MGLMKMPVDLSKDIDERSVAILIISSEEEMKGIAELVCVRCHSKWESMEGES